MTLSGMRRVENCGDNGGRSGQMMAVVSAFAPPVKTWLLHYFMSWSKLYNKVCACLLSS